MEKSEIILRLTFLFSKGRYAFSFWKTVLQWMCSLFSPLYCKWKRKAEFDSLSVHIKKYCNESSLTEQAPEMKVKSICRKSAETVCGNRNCVFSLSLLQMCNVFQWRIAFHCFSEFPSPKLLHLLVFSKSICTLSFFWPWPFQCPKQTFFRINAGLLLQLMQVTILVPGTTFYIFKV